MFEIWSIDGKRAVMHDPDSGEFFVLNSDSTYNGKRAEVFRTDDVYLVTQVWNCFGGSNGDYDIKRVSHDD